MLPFLLPNGTYSGMTVERKGILIGSLDVNELAMVGGSKQFRDATGYTTFQVVSQVGDYLIVKVNLYIRQDIPDDYPGVGNH